MKSSELAIALYMLEIDGLGKVKKKGWLGVRVNQTDCLKILGVHVQSNLKWDTQIDQMCKSFNRKLFFLRQLKRCCTPIKNLLLIYTKYVRPTIEYACPVWFSSLSKTQLDCLEKLQRKALRIILTKVFL